MKIQNQNSIIRVALAEDNDALARSVQDKLELFKDEIRFKYRACDGQDLCEKLLSDHNIDTILMDIEMPRLDGIQATEKVREKYPHIKIIMLTVFDDEDKIFRSIQAGANGYLLKEEPPEKIREGILMIMAGGAPMSPLIAAKSLDILRYPDRIVSDSHKDELSLSKRETEVLEQVSQGLDYKEIAINLFISPATVRKHLENIYGKLQVNNKMRAVEKARKHRII